MLPSVLQDLQKHFEKYPGVGPRQAARFVFFLLKQKPEELDDLINKIDEIKNNINLCTSCYIPIHKNSGSECTICSDETRDKNFICIVEKENDALNLEQTKLHMGTYLIIGENISPINDSALTKARLKNFIEKTKKENLSADGGKEIVLALNNTREGNFTSLYIQELFKKHFDNNKIKITSLGRGLATGNELEYADEATLRHALKNRM